MASNAYKLKLINAQTFNTRRTTLAPVLGGELVKLQVLPTQREEYKDKLLVYTTGEQQIGGRLA